MCDCDELNASSSGDSNPGSQAEPGLRSRSPGSEEPAAGEGADVTLIGGNQSCNQFRESQLRIMEICRKQLRLM